MNKQVSSPTKRIPEIEVMKAIAIVGMIFVHVLECSLSSLENAWEYPGLIPYTLIEFLGGIPAAGVFTFSMGWGAAFSDRSTVKTYLGRALKLGILLFYVNIVYAILPGVFAPELYGAYSEHPWAIIGFNIYSFATVSMLFFALLKSLQDKPKFRGAISIVIVAAIVITDILVKPEAYTTGNSWIDTLIGIFVRENDYSYFPLVSWGIYPIMGYWSGHLYRYWNNRKRFAIINLVIGVVLVPVCYIINKKFELSNGAINPGMVMTSKEYYSLNIVDLIASVGIICLETAIVFGIMTLAKGKLHPFIAAMSKHVMGMFIVQWFFITPLMPVLYPNTDVWVSAAVGVGIFIATGVVVELWSRLTRRFKEGNPAKA